MKPPNFNKRHYEAIAGVLYQLNANQYNDYQSHAEACQSETTLLTVASALAAIFRADNPKFNTTKFLLAAGAKQ